MKAVVLENYNPNLIRAFRSMKVEMLPVPETLSGQILVKVEASPVNPSDIAFLRGGYNIVKPLPAIPGFEGTGKVVAVGDAMPATLIGEKVVFFCQEDTGGAWAEFVVLNEDEFISVHKSFLVEQAACLFVNPFTAWALFGHVYDNQHRAIIQSAAGGQVGKFIRYFAKEHNVAVINLVRKPQQLEQLKAEGNQYVLDTNDKDFELSLNKLASQLRATASIDAVGGELTGKMLNAMPVGGELVLYGGLSGNPVSAIDPLQLIFKNKIISGFNLNDWLAEKTTGEFSNISNHIQMLFMEQKLETKINQSYSLEDFYDGLRAYISNMSAGKVLFKM